MGLASLGFALSRFWWGCCFWCGLLFGLWFGLCFLIVVLGFGVESGSFEGGV